MRCERCGGHTRASICSMFNRQMLCMGCKEKEKAHPEYKQATEAEAVAVGNGDYNFPGIGLPANLRQ